ncbi:hypothetical protein SLE2022_112950 [Rubroshorea leprosula]
MADQEHSSMISMYKARDSSPDSVIFTLESNFSLFSSASASVDRCSFASDAHDRDSFASELSLHLAGHDREHNESSSGPDLDPNKQLIVPRKGEKEKVQKDAGDEGMEDENQLIDSARSSFSLALKECQDRRSRSEILSKKLDRRRPASLDLNNATASSPRLGNMKKSLVTGRKSGAFPSPGTPNYLHTSGGMQKGWSSERVPLHSNGGRKQVSSAFLPLNNGKTLPSKWEDAERWIFSPVSGDGCGSQSTAPAQRRPKSKSGPLGPPGVAYYSLYSPVVPVLEGGNAQNFLAGSPLSAGVITADSLAIHSGSHGGGFAVTEPCMARSVSIHGCSEMLNPSCLLSQDEKPDCVKDAGTDIGRDVSRRDMATQMSPQGSAHSSPEESPFSPSTLSALPMVEMQSVQAHKSEVRDVQVDDRVTMTRWSKKNRARNPTKRSDIIDDWRKKAVDVQASAWDVSDTAKNISKIKRDEAKITAWENLQKAKAEAAIRKLEMKLEKKRSSSMDKIMNKLRSAQKKAQEMRSSMLANQANQITRTSRGIISFCRTRQMGSLSGCFTCYAF